MQNKTGLNWMGLSVLIAGLKSGFLQTDFRKMCSPIFEFHSSYVTRLSELTK